MPQNHKEFFTSPCKFIFLPLIKILVLIECSFLVQFQFVDLYHAKDLLVNIEHVVSQKVYAYRETPVLILNFVALDKLCTKIVVPLENAERDFEYYHTDCVDQFV